MMAWKRVESYWLGYGLPTKQFYFYYQLAGDSSVHQMFPTPEEFFALADMFRNEGPISFNTDGQYFSSAPEEVGEGEGHGQVVGNTQFINLADHVIYGAGVSAQVRRANRTGYQTAYDLAKSQGKTLYQNAGDLEIEIDQTGESAGDFQIGVRLNGDVNIIGAGLTRTRIKFFPDTPAFNAYAFYQDSGRHNSISDCTITGPLNGSDEPGPLFYGIKHQGEHSAEVITDETLTLRNVKIDGKFFATVTSNEGDLICTVDCCDLSAYIQAIGYFVNADTHKQLIIRNSYIHDSGIRFDRGVLVYVSPGVAIDISHSRFSGSFRSGVHINGSSTVKPLYSRITNNVFEETLAKGIQVSKNNRPLIQGNLIKTYLTGIDFFGSNLGAEVIDNEVIHSKPPEQFDPHDLGWHCIGGIGWARGALVKVHGNTFDASAGINVGSTAVIQLSGDGVVWDIESNTFRLNHPGMAGISGNPEEYLAFISRNKFMGGMNDSCVQFIGGTVHAKGNHVEDGLAFAFRFDGDSLVKAYLDDNDVAASVNAFHFVLPGPGGGKIQGSGNNFPSNLAQITNVHSAQMNYQMITPKAGVSPTIVASEADMLLPMSYDMIHISGNVPIDNFYYATADVTKLFCGEIRVIFDDEGATTTLAGNIKSERTDVRTAGKVYRFALDSRTGFWYE